MWFYFFVVYLSDKNCFVLSLTTQYKRWNKQDFTLTRIDQSTDSPADYLVKFNNHRWPLIYPLSNERCTKVKYILWTLIINLFSTHKCNSPVIQVQVTVIDKSSVCFIYKHSVNWLIQLVHSRDIFPPQKCFTKLFCF